MSTLWMTLANFSTVVYRCFWINSRSESSYTKLNVPLNRLVKLLIVFQLQEAIRGEPVDTCYGLPSNSLHLTSKKRSLSIEVSDFFLIIILFKGPPIVWFSFWFTFQWPDYIRFKQIMIYHWTLISPCSPEWYLFCLLYVKRALVRKAQSSPRITAKGVAEILEKAGTRKSAVKQGLNHQNQKCFSLKMKNTLTIKGEAEWEFET